MPETWSKVQLCKTTRVHADKRWNVIYVHDQVWDFLCFWRWNKWVYLSSSNDIPANEAEREIALPTIQTRSTHSDEWLSLHSQFGRLYPSESRVVPQLAHPADSEGLIKVTKWKSNKPETCGDLGMLPARRSLAYGVLTTGSVEEQSERGLYKNPSHKTQNHHFVSL